MDYLQIFESLKAFHMNAFSSIAYLIQSNLWIILTILGAVIITVLNLKEEIEDYVTEEQNII